VRRRGAEKIASKSHTAVNATVIPYWLDIRELLQLLVDAPYRGQVDFWIMMTKISLYTLPLFSGQGCDKSHEINETLCLLYSHK
jgi:hypothetical protein